MMSGSSPSSCSPPAGQLRAAVLQALASLIVPEGADNAADDRPRKGPVRRRAAPAVAREAIEARPVEPRVQAAGTTSSPVDPAVGLRPLRVAIEGPERVILLEALWAFDWSRDATADALRISRSTLYHKMKRHGLLAPGRD
jgi:DNA-binding NtrC family response regulator